MGRNRVLSFMSQFSGAKPTPSPSPPDSPKEGTADARLKSHTHQTTEPFPDHQIDHVHRPATPPSRPDYGSPLSGSPTNDSPDQRQRSNSRPLSLVQAYQPPVMDINEDTIPELQPIYTLLNSHSNKLYQEGYFLKLDDQNTQGKPNADRTWTECFAQLVGTVLSLWDAAELDAAGEDGEVLPKFINLTDASIKMIESLPTRSNDEQPLQNILSISTAGRNRYLLHFNSHHSLIQWTAGIRLAIYEHSTLQEAYTGALIAGKGKTLNNINVIMERARLKTEQWVRVRFGAGVPWRRCWCVITPPDEKEFAKMQKELKKRSPYDRSGVPALKGDIKFYDTRKDGKKQKKAQPIATITDAYSAYAIYPQAKSLIDASTLLKIEGNVTVHSDPPSATEGFIFIMPEVHPMVSGFEMLMRFLFPSWDTFNLYGRPGRLVASTLDPRSIMFAMPKNKRYGYLEILDVSNLILDRSSSGWTEREWRKRLKEATGTRMNAVEDGTRSHSRSASRSSNRLSFGDSGSSRPRVGFAGDGLAPGSEPHHTRNISDPNLSSSARNEYGGPGGSPQRMQLPTRGRPHAPVAPNPGEPASSDDEPPQPPTMQNLDAMRNMHTPEPVSRPPAFNHGPQSRVAPNKAYHSPELRRANSRLSNSTLAQMVTASGMNKMGGPPEGNPPPRRDVDAALSPAGQPGRQPPPALDVPNQHPPRSPMGPPSPYSQSPGSQQSRPGTSEGRRSPYPPGPGGQPSRSPNPQQQSGYRPDQGRPPPGPGGPPGQYGRGRPPPGRGPPNGPPDQYGNYRPGPGGPPPPGGPGGRGGPPPMGRQANSLTPNDIIDHYSSDPPYRGGPPGPPGGDRRGPMPPPHQQRPGPGPGQGPGPGPGPGPYGGPNDSYGREDRPRAGVMKTVGGGEPPLQKGSDFGIPDVNFGPTVNYGASAQSRRPVPEPATAPQSREHVSPEPRAYPAGAPTGHARPEPLGSGQRTMAWQPGGSSAGSAPGSGQRALTPEQYVQHRAGGGAPPYGPGGNLSAGGPPPPQHGGGRGPSPAPPPHGGPPGSFSRPLRNGPQSPGFPPNGQYGSGQGQPGAQPYQGRAF